MNIMSVEGYQAKIEYDAELDMFRDEILGLNGGADFYGRTPEELRAEFRPSLQGVSPATWPRRAGTCLHRMGSTNFKLV